MKKFKIIYHKNECIGAFACLAAAPETWIQSDDKADLIDSKNEGKEVYTKEVDELENNMEAAQSCPVNCIHIIDQKTKKKLI
jgi:ferredoxin